MEDESKKTETFRKNDQLTALLDRLNGYLAHLPTDRAVTTGRPIVMILGVPRSGTTLISQLLAKIGAFSYPSNLISRFYKAPHVGALIQELLFNPDYDYKGELSLSPVVGGLTSDVGKTRGPLEPHEFWFFWRRFFTFPDIPVIEADFIRQADFQGFATAVQGFGDVFGKPVSLKALIINPYVAAFGRAMPEARFVHIRRDPIENMRSLLAIRRRYFGDESIWFSFKPVAFDRLAYQSPERQVAGQVLLLNRMIEAGFAELPPHQTHIVDYSDLCDKPQRVIQELMVKWEIPSSGWPITDGVASADRRSKQEDARLEEAWEWAVETFRERGG